MNEYIENDKTIAPFLLTASFSGLIKFNGSTTQNGIIYWKFTTKNKAEKLLQQLNTKTEPHIPAKDLFEAIEAFWRQVYQARRASI